MIYYFLTVKKVRLPNGLGNYTKLIDGLLEDVAVVDFEYHFEKTRGLHFHAMLRTTRRISLGFIFAHIGEKYGWSVDLQEIDKKRIPSVLRYIRKDLPREAELLRSYGVMSPLADAIEELEGTNIEDIKNPPGLPGVVPYEKIEFLDDD